MAISALMEFGEGQRDFAYEPTFGFLKIALKPSSSQSRKKVTTTH
jgi:hypothetical protein